MRCSRCVLPFLAFYLLLQEISAAVVSRPLRRKRDVHWPDLDSLDFTPRLPARSEQRDLSVGDEGVTGYAAHLETLRNPHDMVTPHRQQQQQHQHQRKASEKSSQKRKITPLDTIGRFKMSSMRNRKDESDLY